MPIQSYSGTVGVAFDNALPLLSPRVQAGSSLPPGLTLNLDRVSGTPQSIGDYTTLFQYDFVAVKISSGGGHSLALRDNGSVIGWGDNFEGQSAPPTGLTGVADIAAGGVHSLALKSDGTVVGWGRDNYNQATPPAGLSSVTAIAAGTNHSLALKSDGTVVGWGLNGNNQATPPAGLTGVTRIAAGTYHSLALKSDGTIIGWGSNSYGQLTIPSGLSGVTDITAGFQVSYALKNDGTVVMWGYNGSGQIDWNQPSPFNVPSGLSGVSYLSTFEKHTLALKNDGIVIAWGNNNNAQTDVPELTESASFNISAGTPIITANQKFSGTSGFVFSASPALTDRENRPVTSWSAAGLPAGLTLNAATGEITGTPQGTGNTTITLTATGLGGTDTETAVISVAKEAMTIISGQFFTGKVGETFSPLTPAYTGEVNSWSATGLPSGLAINSGSGLISGLPINKGESSATINATGPLVALKVASGSYHTLAVKYDGTVVAWGSNFVDGGGTGPLDIPSGLNGVVDVAAGAKFSLALKSDGSVVGWGANESGQIAIPSGLVDVVAIAAGQKHALALKSDGTVVGWGDNSIGQVNVPSELQMPNFSGVVAIAAGAFHSLALKSTGSAMAWGYTQSAANGNNINYPLDYGQTTVPASLGLSIAAIAAGDYHNLAIKKDGTVVAWGRSNEGQTTIPGGLSGVSKIATQGSYCLALKSDGAVVSWGEGSTALNISDAIAVSTSGLYSVALKTNGTLEDWGNSSYGPIPLDSDSNSVSFAITEGVPIITAGQTGSGKVGEAFSKTFSLTDSINRPVTSWSATGLPSWASLNMATGAITGTPQDSGSTTITLTATGPGGVDTETVAISIAAGAPIIVSGQSLTGKVGEVFPSATLTLDDALDRPATSWAATGLPAGLTLNTATGAISGTPTTKGAFTASFTATGVGGTSAASSVAFAISEGAPIITASQTLSGTVGVAFIRTPALTDATNRPVTSWAATALPAWATLNATTGAIMGIPTAAAITTITLTAAGPGGEDTETASISISTSGGGGGGGGTITPTMQLTPQQDFAATLGIAFNRTPSILSGTPVSWYATGLPAWVTINTTTGAISGTPNFTGVFNATVTAQDSNGSVSSTSITLTTVSWNTLEVFIDPRARKILSRANTRSVMQKMFLKRDDLVNFQIVFVNDDQPFGLPSDFVVTVGIKASYASEDFIAFSDSVNGTLSLASDPVQDLFADEPDTVEAIFEVKWEDETSASRTASLPVIIQNTILRGNTAEPGTTTGGGGFTASGLSKYLAARQKILTGETAETTTLTLSEPLAGEAIFHRPLANNLPDHRGWITGVSAVSLQGDTGTEALVAEEDFVFYPDRQCFYFLNPETTGDIEIVGTASRNFINFGVTIEKSVTAASSTSTLIDTASPDFEITSVSITSEDMGTESPDGFYFDRTTSTLFLETKFTCSSAVVVFKDSLGVEFQETFAGLTDASTFSVPKSLSAASVIKVTLEGTEIGVGGIFTPFAVLEKTQSGDDILHLGWNYPTGYSNGSFTVSAAKGSDSFVFTFQYWPGNAFELPRFLDNVHTLKIGSSDALVVFDSTEQKLDFCQAKNGTLHYTATHKAYEGLANGGETLQVVAEIPGVFATTAGTGHHISTLRTLNPSQDWYNWWYVEEGIYFVQIVDDKNVVIYQDDSNGAFAKSRPGYTAEELKPLTLKLPFAALWSLSPRDDTSLFQEAFTPNFATATFSSATYPELDDTQRYAAESMGAGKTITLSTNKTAPVRGVQGVNFTGPKPSYYAGGTVPYFVLATYKWFVVKCVNTNANPLLTANKNYLLCVNNINFDNRAIMVNITNEGYNVAADLYEIKGGN